MECRYGRLTDLLELTGLLQSRLTGLSIDQIAERFGVSRRTAERMLAALRDRFPEIESELRDGHKYWHLPRSTRIPTARMPEELETLSQRVADLEADIETREVVSERLRAISDDVLGTSAVGVFVLDADFRVVWVNHAIESYFGIRAADVIGADKRALIRDRFRHIFSDSEEFERRILTTYENNRHIDNFECHVKSADGRSERWLEHWSQPVATGPYAGGRIEHYVDVTALVGGRRPYREPVSEITACALRSFRDPLAALEAEAESAMNGGGDPATALRRISKLAHDIRRSTDLSLRLASADAAGVVCAAPGEILEAVGRQVHAAAEAAGVQVDVCVDSNSGDVQADRVQVISALAEMACEAIDELSEGGTIRLGAERAGRGTIRFLVASPSLAGSPGFIELPCSHDRPAPS